MLQRHWHLTLMESEVIFQLWLSPTLDVLHCTSVALVLVRMGGVCLRLWNLLVPWPPSMLHAFHHQGWTWTIYVDFEEQWIPQFWTHKPFIFVLGYLSKFIYCSEIGFWVRRVHALLSQSVWCTKFQGCTSAMKILHRQWIPVKASQTLNHNK